MALAHQKRGVLGAGTAQKGGVFRRGSRGGGPRVPWPPPHFLGKKQGGQKPHTQKKKRSKSDNHEARYRLKRTTKHTKYAKIF